ncbi:uncharacterized protein LOC132554623 [Ylistrum balloti]|uniref:uncharacterized protein LOC132554623 n=1 Tax=Ylistrum balloti TaxID=509963 RepID=UPI0029057ED6|nr:uncharacterized protein LOC132554623 [Ylistrum balloti]
MADCLGNLLRAKILALTGIVYGLCSVACVLSALLPFWFVLKVNLPFTDDGTQTITRSINSGLFFFDEGRFLNMMMLGKVDNQGLVPPMLEIAQLLFLLGSLGMIVCCASTFILACRKYASTTGELCLAVATTPLTVCLVASIILVFLSVLADTQAEWHGLPVPDYTPNRYAGFYKVLNIVPEISLNYGTYVACIGVVFSIVGTVFMWIQACCTCQEFHDTRYHMLREVPDLGSSPIPGKHQAFANIGYTRTTPGEINI